MIRFPCPDCDRALRADDSKAGKTAKCPDCGCTFKIPENETDAIAPEVCERHEEESPAHQRRKRKVRRKTSEEERGRLYVLVIIGSVVGMHLLSLISYLAMPDPLDLAKMQEKERFKDLGKDLPEADRKKLERDLKQVTDRNEIQEAFRRNELASRVGLGTGITLHAILLTFLYLRYDWARIVLGVLFLLGVSAPLGELRSAASLY